MIAEKISTKGNLMFWEWLGISNPSWEMSNLLPMIALMAPIAICCFVIFLPKYRVKGAFGITIGVLLAALGIAYAYSTFY